MSSHLVEIPVSDWAGLRDLYESDWPKHIFGYSTLNTFIRWVEKLDKIEHLHIFSLNGDWSDGTFVCMHRFMLFANTTSDSVDRLSEAVSLLPWNISIKDSAIMMRHGSTILDSLAAKQLERSLDLTSCLFYLPKEEGLKLKINCPENIVLKPLSVEHADIVDRVWVHRYVGSLIMIQQFIERNPSVGAFTSDGKLIAWALISQTDTHSMVQVDVDYRRRGLGELVSMELARVMAECGRDSTAIIMTGNETSVRMFTKIGFRKIDEIMWFGTDMVDDREWDKY